MRSWTITIPAPGPWLTANIERFYLGRSAAVRQWREATVWACTAARLPTDITPVTIHAACHYVGRAPVRDRLNLAPTIKALVDALTPPRTFVRKGKTYTTAGYGLLPDDSDKPDTRGLVAMTAARHAVTLTLGCTCGWEPNPQEPTGAEPAKSEWLQWAAHSADAILAALADARLLLQPGGETREDVGHWSPSHAYVWPCGGGGVTRDGCESYAAEYDTRHPPVSHVMTVTSWPDGSRHYWPWRPVDTEETSRG